MVISLILILLLVIFMAFFIGLNLSNVCTFWFFKTFTGLPVAVLALIAFGAGIIFTLLFILVAKTPCCRSCINCIWCGNHFYSSFYSCC